MLELYKPALEDLWLREEFMSDPDTMSYNHAQGGTIPFPKEKWEGWYQKWVVQHENKRYYRYLLNTQNNQWVGEIAYYLDDLRNIYMADIIICARYRGAGCGTEGLKLLCEAARKHHVTALYDDIAIDNPAVGLFLNNGFTVDYQTDDIVMVKRIL